ncbi:hypothetical protein FB451DRAFT_1032218 [Mycena latifolia]|nr:hypothetical protein FB451DRAFT_1032218 [Mycena latifolia]
MLAPQESRDYYKTEEYRELLGEFVEEQRELLDSGLCDALFRKFRARRYPPYELIILTALMMRTGATIKADDLDYVRSILPSVPSRNGFQYPICDDGFRDPGKVQFEAALTYYRNGVPRDFGAPSCFKCGKVREDLDGGELMRCGKCKTAHYCNKKCQTANWKAHKKICFEDGVHPVYSLNV